jgi:transposase InsO family protein
MCKHLNVSKAGYYAWRGREPSDRHKADARLLGFIRQAHVDSNAEYGQPRIRLDLREQGIFISRKRIARIMRIAGIKGKKRCSSRRSSYEPGTLPAAPNVLNRQFAVSQPNRAWVTDITYFATKEKWLYLAVVIDCYSRRVVGWSMDRRVDAALALRALKMALHTRPYTELIVHSDRGSQFACRDYAHFLENCGITASMSRKGNCWDNAVAESFFATLKVGIKQERVWNNHAEARTAIFEYIETWYNPRRRHSTNGYLSPIDFENQTVN